MARRRLRRQRFPVQQVPAVPRRHYPRLGFHPRLSLHCAPGRCLRFPRCLPAPLRVAGHDLLHVHRVAGIPDCHRTGPPRAAASAFRPASKPPPHRPVPPVRIRPPCDAGPLSRVRRPARPRTRMKNRLLNLLAILSLLLCVTAAAMWARSYRERLPLARHDFGSRGARVEVSTGKLYFCKDITGPARYVYPQVFASTGFAGFGYGDSTLGSWVSVPIWFVLLIATLVCFASWRYARRRPAAGLCRACGYDLRATLQRCPECGTQGATDTTPRVS